MGSNKINLTVKKKIILIGIVFLLLILITSIIYYIFFYQKNTNNTNNTQKSSSAVIYKDPGSGETIITYPNQTKESKTLKVNDIVFSGFSNLLKIGLTDTQISLLKTYLTNYFNQLNNKSTIKEISVYKSTIRHTIDSSGSNNTTFNIVISRKTTLKTQLNYSGISDLSIKLFSTSDNSTPVYSASNSDESNNL